MSSAYGVYIHIPFCKAKCKYCAFVSVSDFSLQHAYVDTLIKEIRSAPEKGSTVDTIYIGGGTPSCLYGGALLDIINAVREMFSVDPCAEITVECNPESVNERFVNECIECGVNRVSIGLQSADDRVLNAIGRVHTKEKFIRAIELISSRFDNISSDLILGLPHQTEKDIINSIDIFAKYCTHASVYALTVEEGTPLFKDGYATDDDRIADLYDLARNRLSLYGFERYEVSNFAKPNKQSKHNGKYWLCEPYLGFGVAAHGYDGGTRRYGHTDRITDYISAPERRYVSLTPDDLYNEYVMLRLRTERGINLKDFLSRFCYDFIEKNKSAVDRLINDKACLVQEGRFFIAPNYMFVMNGIIEELMV
ncbi:MAG: radical SAM family heme chaperone HemW [Clostridiales bacterium]|nr:radical SAM family heme chaperone HemW [Clostridiales bacterium]